MMTFRFLHKFTLQEYVEAPAFAALPHIPITAHRARSHWENPKVDENHPLLLLAEQEGELMGYLGVMPEWVYGQTKTPLACGWLTCMWVSGKARGQGLAGQLLVKMNEAYEGRVLLADYVPATIRVYEKTKAFTGPLSLNGFRGYLRFDTQTILTARYPKLEKFKGLLGVIDRTLNGLIDFRYGTKKKLVHAAIVPSISAKTATFINTQARKESFGRNADDVRWMMKYPWVLEGDRHDPLNSRYQFSAIDSMFKNFAIEVKDDRNQLVGFLLCTVRNQFLKIPHAWYLPEHVDRIADVLEYYMKEWQISTFTIFYPELAEYFRQHGGGFIYRKNIQRNYLFSKGFAEAVDIEQLQFQDGDGDVGFT